VFLWQGTATFENCEFAYNFSNTRAGGVLDASSNLTLINCTFLENVTLGSGGGLYAVNQFNDAYIENCVFDSNVAYTAGGGMNNFETRSIVNCLFTGNYSPEGGGLRLGGGTLVANCTFLENDATIGGGIYLLDYELSTPRVANCIVRDNTAATGNPNLDGLGTAVVSYSNIEGGYAGTAIIDADPLFVDPIGGDLHLAPGSPCIDAGHNWAIAGTTDIDLDGNPRFADDPATADTGCGIPVIVDMGPYEYQGEPFPVKLGDIDGNGVVNVKDLLLLLADWGPCLEACCPADLDLDGAVAFNDFLLMLANWG
jgi:hypothetical protein